MATYIITGATGNTGAPITKGLLEKGHSVKIIGRDANKAQHLIDAGAEFHEGSLSDSSFLTNVFAGADAAYLMIPPHYGAEDFTAYQESVARSYAKAVETSGLKHAVTLSSIGTHSDKDVGVVEGLKTLENALNQIDSLHVHHLRASYFLENGLGLAGMAKQLGFIGTPVKPDLKIPMVTTQDIAQVALHKLLTLDFEGNSFQYILGKGDYSYSEIAKIYGKAIGKDDLNYTQFPYEDAQNAFVDMGLSQNAAKRMIDFVKQLNDGEIFSDARRNQENTTPTGAEEFSLVFKDVYEQL